MVYQHPLAYLLGLEGLALLRAWAGDYDQDFVHDRLAEVRRLMDSEPLVDHPGVIVERGDTVTGYRQYAPTYDTAGNGLFPYDEPIVRRIVDTLPPGTALDAACGTGRYTAYLVARGHRTIGVDSSPDMLAYARRRVPSSAFLIADLHEIPLPDDAVDVIVCGLALAHVPALGPVLAEFARVLRPGGHVVISDVHVGRILQGSVISALGPHGEPGLVPTYRHSTGDYLRAALQVGLQVRRCEEPQPATTQTMPPPTKITVGPWPDWPWTLRDLIPEATAATSGPLTIVWHFQLTES